MSSLSASYAWRPGDDANKSMIAQGRNKPGGSGLTMVWLSANGTIFGTMNSGPEYSQA